MSNKMNNKTYKIKKRVRFKIKNKIYMILLALHIHH